MIRQAIDQADPQKITYELEVTQFQHHLSRVYFDQYRHQADTQREELFEDLESIKNDFRNEVDRYQTRTVQFLGFFAALLGAVIVSAQITTQVNFNQAKILIIVFTGGLLTAFGGFSLLLPHEDIPVIRVILVILVGIIISGGTILAV